MDDIALLKDMADRTPLPGHADLAPARARLLAEIDAPTRPRGRRRLWLSGAAAVGLAAAITAVVALGGLEPVGVAPPEAGAAEVLHLAADAARKQPATPPRPDQFVYTRTKQGDGSVREAWLSVDGTHDGLIAERGQESPLYGCRDGRRQADRQGEVVPGLTEPCEPDPAYLVDLPTDAAGMREYLLNAGGTPGDVNGLGKNVAFLFSEYRVPPASLAAVFEAVAEHDGLEIVEDATDGAGRRGVGVRWPNADDKSASTLVFDQEPHAFLGLSTGEGWGAQLEQAVVDEVGQRP